MSTQRVPKREELQTVAHLRKSLREFANATAIIAGHHDLTSRQYDLCLLIESAEHDIIAVQIAEALQLSPNAASELISRAAEPPLRATLVGSH